MADPIAAPESVDRLIPPLILTLTGVAGLVDAVSYLAFDRAFAATQTGNLIFLGLAGAQAPGFVVGALATTLIAFFAGAFLTGRGLVRLATGKTRLFHVFTAAQFVPVALSAVVQATVPSLGVTVHLAILLGLLAFAMGIQAAGTNRLRIPGLERTTVLTTTMTLVAADSFASRENHAVSVRWLVSILVLVAGAAVGAELYSHVGLTVPLAVAAALIGIVALGAYALDVRERPRGLSRSQPEANAP